MMNYEPNIQASLVLAQRILPLVREQIPEATLTIAGRDPGHAVKALSSDAVTVTGTVEDPRPPLRRSRGLRNADRSRCRDELESAGGFEQGLARRCVPVRHACAPARAERSLRSGGEHRRVRARVGPNPVAAGRTRRDGTPRAPSGRRNVVVADFGRSFAEFIRTR